MSAIWLMLTAFIQCWMVGWKPGVELCLEEKGSEDPKTGNCSNQSWNFITLHRISCDINLIFLAVVATKLEGS